MRSRLPVVVLSLALAGCFGDQPAPSASVAPPPAAQGSGVTPSSFRLPAGEGCAGEVARFRAVMDNDLSTGHVNKSVYEKVVAEIGQADATCKGGNSGGAIAQIRATKSRYGYP